ATRCHQLAAALERDSMHPLAAALKADAAWSGMVARDLQQTQGQGVEGWVGAVRYRLGNAAHVAALAGPAPASGTQEGASWVYLGTQSGWLARFVLSDPQRADARELVRAFQARGKTVILLSGDRQGVVDQVAGALGIDLALGGQLPDQKLAFVQRLQAGGAVVAMVGDGINDAAVLGAADVSFAMGGGAALAQVHADCVLLSGSLASLGEAAICARLTMRVIRQNLAWATLYNLVAIPAAALGWLNPWMAGVGMAASSCVVLANALRLRRAGR
ncbi:MAG TPA: HAD-IC family P-type ATPase, partial [Telluria sp.]|nr:HAD-IC family P-type ATPase [Telluria sp.]